LDQTHRYDVTAAQAAAAEATVVCPLSALTPRMRHLQDHLLPPLRLPLAADPEAEVKRWAAAEPFAAAKAPPVRVWAEGVGLLRPFRPGEDGGADRLQMVPPRSFPGYPAPDAPGAEPMTRKRFFELSLVRWTTLPAVFRDTRQPYNVALGPLVRAA